MIGPLKRLVERYPSVAGLYRFVRDQRAMARSRPAHLPLGFTLRGNEAMAAGTFEQNEVDLLRRLLEASDAFVDVGANVGYYTALARASGRRVIAVEPLRQNLDYLYLNMMDNGWADVEVHPMALGSESGLRTLFGAATGASFVEGWAGASSLLRCIVPVTTLDTLLTQRFEGRRLLIKIDVEGGEHEVLLGAARTLRRHPAPTWMVEICLSELRPDGANPNYRSTFELFWDCGYTAYTADDVLRVVTSDDVSRWVRNGVTEVPTTNFLFTHQPVVPRGGGEADTGARGR